MNLPECRTHIQFCSVNCLVKFRRFDVNLLERLFRMFKTQAAVADVLSMPYSTFRAKLKRQGLSEVWKEWAKDV
jgi:hypothetical protein